MNKSKLLVGIAILCYVLYIVFQFKDDVYLSNTFRALIIPAITILYFFRVSNKSFYFSGFLVLYSLSELMCIVNPFVSISFDYYVGNALYMTAYLFLIYEILKSMNAVYVLKHYFVHLIVLSAVSVYIVSVLLKISSPVLVGFEFIVEFVYNLLTLILLSIALINYIHKDSKKSFLMFVGSLCIVFSEMIQIAYYYISTNLLMEDVLNLIYTALLLVSFWFFYAQSKLEERPAEDKRVLVNS